MVQSPIEEFEGALTERLQQAAVLSGDALELIDSLIPEGTSIAALPEGTVQRLHLAATMNFRAAVVCLRLPETSVASYALYRGVLEAWSHLAFINDPAEGGDVRCRALRYERGASTEWRNTIRATPEGSDVSLFKQQHDERIAMHRELWTDLGCSGKIRTYGQVDRTLNALAIVHDMPWLPFAWRTSSATVHMYGSEFAFRDQGNGTTNLVWSLPLNRTLWLNALAGSFVLLTEAAASILRCPAPRLIVLREAGRPVVETPELRALALTAEQAL